MFAGEITRGVVVKFFTSNHEYVARVHADRTLVRSLYVAALDRPATNNMPAFIEWLRDTQAVQQGVVVGQGNWQTTLAANRYVCWYM